MSAKPFHDLRAAIDGAVVVASDGAYRIASQPWNARFSDVPPEAVVMASSASDVALAVAFAREHGTPFVMRNGRHSMGGFSATDGMVIDVSRLDHVRVDAGEQHVTFGAGLTNLPLYRKLWHAKMSVPAGTCPTVGVTGLSCAGGFGKLSRQHGLTCDNIVEVKIVTADGRVLAASENENADLLWACKGGGGGNFGAIVELTARLHPVDMHFTEIAYSFELSDAVAVMTAFQEWVASELPDRGHCWTEIVTGDPNDGGAMLHLEFTLAGTEEEAQRLGQRLLRAAGAQPRATTVLSEPYFSIMRDWLCAGLRAAESWYAGISPHGVLHRPAFYAKSDMMRQDWPREAYEALVEAVARRQADRVLTPEHFDTAVNVGKIAFEAAGGAVARVPAASAAFAHRDARYVVQYQSRWHPGTGQSVADANVAWVQATYDAVRPWLSGGAYQGYSDPYLSDWEQQYYGASLPRLREVKRKYDPENVFHYAQSIRG